MNVIYYSSDEFSEICGVSLISLCSNNRDADSINVFIVEDQISEKNKQRLQEIVVRFGRKLTFIPLPKQTDVFPDVDMNLGRTFARMIIARLLPNDMERVLSLDSDTLILDSLEDMYNTDLGGTCIAGSYDCVGAGIQKKFLKASDELIYCNAGVFLIDLEKWRQEDIEAKLLEYVQQIAVKNQKMYFLEQDIMNLMFEGRMTLLDARYNLLTSIALFDYKEVIKMKHPVRFYTEEQVLAAKASPGIVHATTCFYVRRRMWVDGSDHPYAATYVEYRNLTPWKNLPRIPDDRSLRKRMYAGFWHILPRSVSVSLAAFAINHVRPHYADFASRASFQPVA